MSTPTTSNTTRPLGQGLRCRLNDDYFRLLLTPQSQLNIETEDLQPPRIDTAQSADDIRPTFGTIFSRSDFSGGEGLDLLHTRTSFRPESRFWDSSGVDVRQDDPGQLRSITLSLDNEQLSSSSYDGPVANVDGTIYIGHASSNSVQVWTDPLAASPSPSTSTITGAANAPVMMAGLGDRLYVALGSDGLYELDGTWSQYESRNTYGVWTAKARVLSASTTGLYEDNVATAIHTLPSGDTYTAVAGSGPLVVVGTSAGELLGFTESSGNLDLTSRYQFLDDSVTEIASLGLQLLVGTSSGRLWKVEVDVQSGSFSDIQLVRTFPSSVANLHVDSDRALFTVDETDSQYLWTYDFLTSGRNRLRSLSTTSAINGLSTISGNPIYTVDADGSYRRSLADHVSSGYVVGPLADFFTSADKTWAGGWLDIDNPTSDEYAQLYFTTNPDAILDPDHDDWRLVAELNLPSSREWLISGAKSRYLAGMIKLYPSTDLATSPAVRSFAFRAYPSSADVLVTLPINVSDLLERPGRRSQVIKGYGNKIWARLKGTEGSVVRLALFDPEEEIQGTVWKVSLPIPVVSPSGSQMMVANVTVRGQRVAAGVTFSTGTFASYRLFAELPSLSKVS